MGAWDGTAGLCATDGLLLKARDSESGDSFAILADLRGVRILCSEGALCGESFALLTDVRGARIPKVRPVLTGSECVMVW